jgi:hypothetical protein
MAGGGMKMNTTITLAAGLGEPMALLVASVAEMIAAVAATMEEGRGSMGNTGGGIWIQGGTGRRRGEGHFQMAGATRMGMKMGHLGFGGSDAAIGGVMK